MFQEKVETNWALKCADCGLSLDSGADEPGRELDESCSCHSGKIKSESAHAHIKAVDQNSSIGPSSNTDECQTTNPTPSHGQEHSKEPSHSTQSNAEGSISTAAAAEILGARFEIMEQLGQGGMGTVFKAYDRQLDKTVAVKIMNPQASAEQNSLKRFEREAKAAMRMSHPHLVAAYDFGVGSNETPFLVMDYLDGSTLDALLKSEGSLETRRATNIFIQICESVSYAHSMGVVHRDIKPSNILLTEPANGVDFAQLFDFGIAHVMPHRCVDLTQELTPAGGIFGSPLYLSPEQCHGAAATESSDIHALGCTMYKALTGAHPFEGKNFVETITKITNTKSPVFSSFNLDHKISTELEEIVQRCLEKNPDHRYQSVNELLNDLRRVQNSKPISISRKKQESQRKRLRWLVAAGVLLVTFGLGVNSYINSEPAPSDSKFILPSDKAEDAKATLARETLAQQCYERGSYDNAISIWQGLIKGSKTDQYSVEWLCKSHQYAPYWADTLTHIARAYGKKSYEKVAAQNYLDALRLYELRPAVTAASELESSAVSEYAELLRKMSKPNEADTFLSDYKKNGKVTKIPRF